VPDPPATCRPGAGQAPDATREPVEEGAVVVENSLGMIDRKVERA
jgi:hypothetical protein